jgi:hypothetical protein
MYSASTQVLLVQTAAVSNTPDHYRGSAFTHHCYDSFFHDIPTANCVQCLAGSYKNATVEPDAISCKECPEVSASFALRYFSASSEHFLRKELSQFFAPIPGPVRRPRHRPGQQLALREVPSWVLRTKL